MWLERIIVRKAERRLLPYRRQATQLGPSLQASYAGAKASVQINHAAATHWHGTGRFHYQHQTDSRYDAVDTTEIIDVLTNIISRGELQPHHDPWIDSGGNTVSLATTRMHARAFARIHASTSDTLRYELGSIQFWLRLYFALLFVWLVTNVWQHRTFITHLIRKVTTRDIQNWASAIRKPREGKVLSISDMFKGDIPTSDITGNYPILIGIAADAKQLIDTIPLTHKVEQRSLQPITLDQFTHLEVPLQYIAETQAVLEAHQLDLPVLALEHGDLYQADTPLAALAFS